ncbi:MAG: 23S rRNA (pseudouridine(1915)-N(3))-methyltransferase RlmH [Candidatus Parcubacteria bacterium]|nr:23S rRNA (pseudouridine(1915)-N(3))-methyltransferase RlmH [Burkholderiales bacterium]
MARLSVVAVANRLPAWAEAARDQYLGRMPRGYELTVVQLKPREAGLVREKIPKGARMVALDERGKDLTTKQFAALLGEPTAFVIGCADGLDPSIRNDAALLLRLSALTLPHALAQVVLCEQIYRAATLLTGHPYHRE